MNGKAALGLEVLALLLRVLEEQTQLLPPEAVGRLKQLQAQVRLSCPSLVLCVACHGPPQAASHLAA